MSEEKKVHVRLVRHKWADEIEIEKKNRRRKIIFICAIVTAFVMGSLFGGLFSRPVVYQGNSDFAVLESVYHLMGNRWYFAKDNENINQDLLDSAIRGMVDDQGDIHTQYMSREEMSEFSTSLETSFVGIGIRYNRLDGNLLVQGVILDSPAEKAGVQAGDLILKADGVELAPLSDDDVQNRVRGKEGSKVIITLQRGQEVFDVEITRHTVHTSVDSKVLENQIGYVQITTFGDKTAPELKMHLDNLQVKNIKDIIIDLRDNGGGYLTTLQAMSSYFLENGSVVLQQEHADGSIELTKTKGNPYDFNVVLLVNENSASCSEVFAAALREHNGVKIVGTTTYGKGTVQVVQAFSNGSALKYTTAAWLTPNGVSINGEGIHPDVEVFLDDALYLTALSLEDDEEYQYDVVAEEVVSMQKILKFLGYTMKRVDGYFDKVTVSSLKEFQADNALEVTGVLDDDTANALNRAVLVKWNTQKDEVDTQLKAAIALFK